MPTLWPQPPPQTVTSLREPSRLNAGSMRLGLLSVKLAAAFDPQLSGVLTTVRPSTLRRLSQPRTSTVPVVSEMRTMATRLELMRESTSTLVMVPPRTVAGSPLVTT